MKYLLILALFALGHLALADNRESGGGAPSTLTCHDQFTLEASTTIISAPIVNATTLNNVTVQTPRLNGQDLQFASLALKPYTFAGVNVLSGSQHVTDYSVVLTLGSEWTKDTRPVGQVQFYCDECGSGAPSFHPNLYCSVQ